MATSTFSSTSTSASTSSSRPKGPTGLTMTQIAYFSRIGLIWGLVVLIFLLVGKIAYDGFLDFLSNERCRQPEALDRSDGKLPPLNFTRQALYEKPQKYYLQLHDSATGTISHLIPETPLKDTTLRVYPAAMPLTGVAADRRVRDIATAFSFTNDPQIIDGETYRWQNGNNIFEINRRTLDFSYQTDYLNNAEYLHAPGRALPTSATATKLVKDTLEKVTLLPADVASVAAEVTYMKTVGNALVPANTSAEADFLQVALSREPLQQEKTDNYCRPLTKTYSFVEPASQPAPIVAIVGRNWINEDVIVSLIDTHQDYDWENYGVYSVRTLAEAWQVVQSGEAYIADPGNLSEAYISEISLGYFEDNQEQPFLQPVYVFSGDNGFTAYVTAVNTSEIDANWYLLNAQQQTGSSLSVPSSLQATAAASSPATASATP